MFVCKMVQSLGGDGQRVEGWIKSSISPNAQKAYLAAMAAAIWSF